MRWIPALGAAENLGHAARGHARGDLVGLDLGGVAGSRHRGLAVHSALAAARLHHVGELVRHRLARGRRLGESDRLAVRGRQCAEAAEALAGGLADVRLDARKVLPERALHVAAVGDLLGRRRGRLCEGRSGLHAAILLALGAASDLTGQGLLARDRLVLELGLFAPLFCRSPVPVLHCCSFAARSGRLGRSPRCTRLRASRTSLCSPLISGR